LPQHGWSLVRKVDGSDPEPTTLNDPKSLHQSPSGASGSLAIHSCRRRMSAALISLIRTRSSSFLRFHAGRLRQFNRGISISRQTALQKPRPQSFSILCEPCCRQAPTERSRRPSPVLCRARIPMQWTVYLRIEFWFARGDELLSASFWPLAWKVPSRLSSAYVFYSAESSSPRTIDVWWRPSSLNTPTSVSG
jgi:hypothetical protein